MEYDFTSVEDKWKRLWAEREVYRVKEDTLRPKYYVLDMFPYPSGAGLHVGHPLGYVASDIYARYKRLKGYNVLHPMGYDAFGLPAEQYAIETGTHPAETTEKAISRYREQLDKIGFSFDWSRQVKTCDPDYYKWTQWIFLKLFNSWYNREHDKAEPIETLIAGFEKWGCTKAWKQYDENLHAAFNAHDWKSFSTRQKERILQCYRLAYRSFTEVNWCEALGCVLANDEVKDGKSERGGYPVTRKKMRQWSLRITEYADRLLEGLNRIDWSESLKEQQRNWIGRSEGCLLKFRVDDGPVRFDGKLDIEVFTTRVDTLFGATFLVVAPEHEFIEQLITNEQRAEMDAYLAYVNSRSDVERQQEKKVTGCFTGSYAIHPFTGEKLPIWTAEYVLAGYGTGAIMAVPADDERDRKFAEKFGLPIVEIIDKSMHPGATIEDKAGKMINSDFLNGLEVTDAIEAMIQKVEEMGLGQRKVNYKLRDASYSRQRYWGEPFPIKYVVQGEPDSAFVEENSNDEADMPVALSESELPLALPEVSSFKPTGDGRSPLANNAEWVANGYETDTMPGYAGSSWYFLRYMDPNNPNAFAAKDKLNYWQNVDIYFGGAEHAVGHLLYSRMWHKVLYDLGYVPTDEPFKKLVNQGMIQGVSKFFTKVANGHVGVITDDSTVTFVEVGSHGSNLLNEHIKNLCSKIKLTIEKEFNRSDNIFTIYVSNDLKSRLPNHDLMEGWRIESEFCNSDVLDVSDAVNNSRFLAKNMNHFFICEKGIWVNDIWFGEDESGKFYCSSEVEKMSKSKYNVVNPDDVIAKYGADCFRMFEMFLGPIEQSKPWDDKGISGVSNFLKKFWRLFYEHNVWKVNDESATAAELKVLHKTLKKLEDDIERLNFNTCVSALMIAVNELTTLACSKRAVLEPLVIAMAPFAPFMTEELWEKLANHGSVHQAALPKVEAKYLVESSHKYPVSINGKVRAEIELPLDITPQDAEQQVLELEGVKKWTNGNAPKKFIYVKGRIINVVM